MKKHIIIFVSLLFSISFTNLSAQNKYLVLFKDKANSDYSINTPKAFLSDRSIARRIKQNIKITERDLPPNTSNLKGVSQAGGKIIYTSRWLNGALIETTQKGIEAILKLPFVKGLEGKGDIRNSRISIDNQQLTPFQKFEKVEITDNGLSQNQLAMLGADLMHQKGFKGEGKLVAILDAGFLNADRLSFFKHLFDEKRIVYTYDFTEANTNVYNDDSHGTHVLSCMAAYEENKIVGTAPKASYVLFRTEDVATETRLEEAHWLFAAERADSLGVEVINSSLGYNQFDNPFQNYVYKTDLDGDKALITRAADWAAQVGILVVNSAGNEGNKAWKYITSPADADSIIAVGSVNANRLPSSFSSFGPSSDGRIKPELAAQGGSTVIGTPGNSVGIGSGTSYASPLLAGFATSLWGQYPDLTNMQLRAYLIRSATQYTSPDDRVGYGIPNYEKAVELIELDKLIDELKKQGLEVAVFPNPTEISKDLKIWILKEIPAKSLDIQLINTLGVVVYSLSTSEKRVSIPLEKINVNSGNYLLKVTAEDLNFTKRIWIEK